MKKSALSFGEYFILKLDDFLGGATSFDGQSRTFYTFSTYNESNLNSFIFLIINFIKYFTQPLIFNSKIVFTDFLVIAENYIRILIIFYFLIFSNFFKNSVFDNSLFIFIFYIILEGFWSIGTVSWGTAFRHHLPSLGLLLMLVVNYKKSKI